MLRQLSREALQSFFKKDAVEVTAALEEKDFVDGINKSRPSLIIQ